MKFDDQAITGLCLSSPNYDYHGVGRCGVEKITVEYATGQAANVPWFAVWKHDKVWRRVNAALVEEVVYKDN